MRNDVLKSLIVCLNHESHARRGGAGVSMRSRSSASRGFAAAESSTRVWLLIIGLDKVGMTAARSSPDVAKPHDRPHRPCFATRPRISARRTTTALVPTMAALYEAHLALIRLARRRATKVIVSIFVNSTQFAPSEISVRTRAPGRPTSPNRPPRMRAGDEIKAAMAGGKELAAGAGFTLDYFEVRHAGTPAPIASANGGPMRILVAARIGNTRLIAKTAI
jgi:hypothetical protein